MVHGYYMETATPNSSLIRLITVMSKLHYYQYFWLLVSCGEGLEVV